MIDVYRFLVSKKLFIEKKGYFNVIMNNREVGSIMMNEKEILTFEQAQWVEYLEIDEKTGERKLKKETPEEIKKMYEEYLKQLEKKKQMNEFIAK